jgi:hypothetical protein
MRQNHEETDIAKRTNAGKRAEKTGKCLQIKVSEIFRIRLNYKRGYKGGERRYKHNRVFLYKRPRGNGSFFDGHGPFLTDGRAIRAMNTDR